MNTAVYPGSFDPITNGHIDILKRASKIFDRIIVVILINSQKNSLFLASERVSMIQGIIDELGLSNVEVDTNEGLLIDYCKSVDSNIVIRGLRSVTDFEYELQIAQVNRVQSPGLETVFLTTSLDYSYLSSTIVKEFASYGGDISSYVPESVQRLVEAKINQNKER